VLRLENQPASFAELEGLTMAETADASGCIVPTAKIRIHRARLRLTEALQQQCDFYRDGHDTRRCDRKSHVANASHR